MSALTIGTRLLAIGTIATVLVVGASLFVFHNQVSLPLALGLVDLTCVAVFVALAVTLRMTVLAPLQTITSGLDRLAKGNFSVAFDTRRGGELGQIAGSAELIRRRLNAVINGITVSGHELSNKLGELTGRAGQATDSSHRQSEDAIAMATAVEMMTYGIDSMASQAEQVQTLSTQAEQLSNRGAEVIEMAMSEIGKVADSVNASSTMLCSLKKQSEEIGSIIKVITGIAAQTNLLALNAAIEAARAGENGRGFAVVADEVRNLAARTTNSTGEIAQMIQSIQADTAGAAISLQATVNQVTEGTSLAKQASLAIIEIKAGSLEVAQAVSEISKALHQHSDTSREYSNQVVNIAQVSQEISVAVNAIANTAKELDSIATQLRTTADDME